MARVTRDEKDERPSRARRVGWAVAKGTGRVAWGTAKLVAKGLAWSAKMGYRAGKRVAKGRRPDPPER